MAPPLAAPAGGGGAPAPSRGVGAIAVSIAAGAAVSATVGTMSLLSGGVIGIHGLATVWRTWLLGDASGALLVVPLALAWYQPLPKGGRHGRRLEAAAVVLTCVALAEFASRSSSPLTYLVFPALILAAPRFGQRGAP